MFVWTPACIIVCSIVCRYAPECLHNLRFTTKGDVWSYGVTLWEMFSHGELPTQILSRVIKDSSVTSAQAAFKKVGAITH